VRMEAVRLALLAALLAAAVWRDWRTWKLPNRLTVSFAAAGLALSALAGGAAGLLSGAGGLVLGLAGGMLLWVLGAWKAGDAKLFAALGALMGPGWLADCFCWSLICGAAVGTVYLLARGELLARLGRIGTYLRSLVLTRRFRPYPCVGDGREIPFSLFAALGAALSCALPLWR
jgi:Flp pilus assembly protein protease CpaA